jgi:hypothetical protein
MNDNNVDISKINILMAKNENIVGYIDNTWYVIRNNKITFTGDNMKEAIKFAEKKTFIRKERKRKQEAYLKARFGDYYDPDYKKKYQS